eukprot:1145339-Pelagomonas_calceolata.AAC.4
MLSGSRWLPPLHAAHHAAKWTALIKLLLEKKRRVYAGHRPLALRKSLLASKLARASPEVPQNYTALGCLNPTMNGMHTMRHHVGLSFCVEALSKDRHGSSLFGMDTCRNERLLEQDIKVPENISRAITDRVFPHGIGSSARNQSHPGAVLVRSIPGRPSHIDPTKTLPQDRNIRLVGFKFRPDTNPFPTPEAAIAQHIKTAIRLKTSSLRNPNRNNKVTLHIILVGVAGTIINTRHAHHFQGTSGGGFAGRGAVESRRRRVWASRSMADNPPDPQ